jgi:probable rRNA maturation factor
MQARLRQGYDRQARFGSEGRRSQALRVLVGDEWGRPGAAPGLARWLARVVPSRVRGSVGIAMVSDARIRRLNHRYRGVDCATDVLSFPAESDLGFLGDIVIARGVAKRQARAAGHSERTELRVLALHGLLHLLGYDHERDGGRMQRVERRWRRKGRLREGLIDRAGARRTR